MNGTIHAKYNVLESLMQANILLNDFAFVSLRMRRRCRIDTGEAISLGQSQERHGNDRHRHRKETGPGEIEETPLRTC